MSGIDASPWIVAGLLALATFAWRGPRAGTPARAVGPTGAMGSAGSTGAMGSVGGPRRWAAIVRSWWSRRPNVREQARSALVAQTCEALDLCVAGLRAGLDLPAVLDFADAEIGLSAEVRDALRAPPGRLASGQVFRVISQAQELSSSAGVPLAEAWESAAALMREHEGLRRKIAVALAGPRATMRVLTLLPLAGPVVGIVFGIDPWRLYSGSPITVACLGLGLGLLFVGRWWCARLVSRLGLAQALG